MSDNPTPTVPDLLMRIMQQQDTGFGETRQALSELNRTINRIDLEVALLKRDTEQMAGIPTRVQSLESARDMHARLLTDTERAQTEHNTRIGDLEDTSSERKGWEGFGGKILYLLSGAAFVALVGIVVTALRQ